MKSHPYLKAYMAGITAPTIFLLVVLSTLVGLRRFGHVALPLEHFAIFPMAVVPNAWGVWNMLRVASATAGRLPLGGYGALLAVVLPLLGAGAVRALGVESPLPLGAALVAWLVAMIAYYLVWKHVVGFLNELLGVSG